MAQTVAQEGNDLRLPGSRARLQRSRHWSVQVQFERWQRRSTVAGQDADQDTVGVTLAYRNR